MELMDSMVHREEGGGFRPIEYALHLVVDVQGLARPLIIPSRSLVSPLGDVVVVLMSAFLEGRHK